MKYLQFLSFEEKCLNTKLMNDNAAIKILKDLRGNNYLADMSIVAHNDKFTETIDLYLISITIKVMHSVVRNRFKIINEDKSGFPNLRLGSGYLVNHIPIPINFGKRSCGLC